MRNVRKNHSPTLKAQIVLELLREEKSISQLSSEYGIHPTQLNRWRKHAIENLSQLYERDDKQKKAEAEYEAKIEQLYTEIGRLSTQITWLKKKGIDVEEK
jgi:transposase-like protein